MNGILRLATAAGLLLAATHSQAVVVYDAEGHIAALTDVTIRDANGVRHTYDVRFVHDDYLGAYPSAGYTQLPHGWPFDFQGSLRAWAGIIDALDQQGADRVAFAGGQTTAYLPWLNTGIQAGYPCTMCLRTSYGYLVPAEDRWTYGGLRWVTTYATGDRHPADARGPVVTWIDFTPTSPVPEPNAALSALAGLAALAALARWRGRRPAVRR